MNSTTEGGLEMSVSFPVAEAVIPSRAVDSAVEIPQLGRRAILAIWAAAALPMAVLACLTIGLIWQFVLVAVLVYREQRSLRWSVVRDALWLRSPRSPRNGRVGGRLWLVLIPLVVAFAAEGLISGGIPTPANRDMGTFLDSHAGQAFLHGAWGWFALIVGLGLFNTVLGEELLFRGFLLPRMNGAFGRRHWVANGILFAGYHLHMPWAIPTALLDTFILAYPSKRYRSAWIGIAVHSAQSVVVTAIVLGLVV